LDKGTSEEVAPELFSEKERRSIVRSFIEAYLRGQVTIREPEIGEADLEGRKFQGQDIVQMRRSFNSDISIVAGTVKSTRTQFDAALARVFGSILATRGADALKGEFLSITDSDRLTLLEHRIAEIERLLEELQTLTRVRGNQPP
jgi:hypothetical protein